MNDRTSRLRVLLVSPLPPPTGGMATWTGMAMGGSLADTFELRVLDTAPPDKEGVEAERHFRFRRVGKALWVVFQSLFVLARFRPDLVHVNTPYRWAYARDGLVCWVAGWFGAKCLLHFHGGDFPEFLDSLRGIPRRMAIATLRRCGALVVLESHTEKYLRALVPETRVVRLANPVRIEATRPRQRVRRDGWVDVAYVGWLVETKGIGELLSAVEENPSVRLTLAGPEDPTYRSRIASAVDRLGDRVRLLGPCSHERALEILVESDIQVLPSYIEGFPIVVLEAMAAGLPVLATSVGAVPDVIRDGIDGFVIPPRDRDALSARLGQLAADPELRERMGQSARARVEEHYAEPVVFGHLGELYRELV